MDSTQLTPEQVARVKQLVRQQLRLLTRLSVRMQELRFPAGDPLVQATLRARNVMQDLYTCVQYCGCTADRSRPPRKEGRIT